MPKILLKPQSPLYKYMPPFSSKGTSALLWRSSPSPSHSLRFHAIALLHVNPIFPDIQLSISILFFPQTLPSQVSICALQVIKILHPKASKKSSKSFSLFSPTDYSLKILATLFHLSTSSNPLFSAYSPPILFLLLLKVFSKSEKKNL